MLKILIAFLAIQCLVHSQAKEYSCTEDWFNRSGLNKYITSVPRTKLQLYYGRRMVNLGNYFTPRSVRYQPSVYWNGKSDDLYTLIMIDPDAGEYSQILHWLIVNIQGSDLTSGDVFMDYIGAAPPKDSGYHRYAFLMYRQKEKITDKLPRASSRSLNNRSNFNVNRFVKMYKLEGPVWGNYMEAKYDSYVDQFYDNMDD